MEMYIRSRKSIPTRMIVPPFLVSELCPFENRKKILYAPLVSNRYIYPHETLHERRRISYK